jgi:hypothetical protein
MVQLRLWPALLAPCTDANHLRLPSPRFPALPNQCPRARPAAQVNSTAAMISAINSTQYALGYAPAPAPLPGQLAIENAAGRFVASQLGQGAGSALLSANLSELGTQYPAFDADEQNRLWADVSCP